MFVNQTFRNLAATRGSYGRRHERLHVHPQRRAPPLRLARAPARRRDPERSGDDLAGVARGRGERVAARAVLADLTLPRCARAGGAVRARRGDPPGRGRARPGRPRGRDLTVGQFREWLLVERRRGDAARGRARPDARDGGGGVQADVELDLMTVARSAGGVRATNHARPARAGCRRASSPTIRPTTAGILASAREGLLLGCGDAVIGINPATDTPSRPRDLLTASTSVLKRNDDPDPALRAVARHGADEGARARLPDGPDVPVGRRHRGREQGVRHQRSRCSTRRGRR